PHLTQPSAKAVDERGRRLSDSQETDAPDLACFLRQTSERPHHRRATEKRDELAPSHCPMHPVLPTERIAHLGMADCCIHPSGRNEMIAITPPIIFSKEVAQNRPPHFLARTSLSTRNRFTPNFQGWGLDENLKPKSPPYRGVDAHGVGSCRPATRGGCRQCWGSARAATAQRCRATVKFTALGGRREATPKPLL